MTQSTLEFNSYPVSVKRTSRKRTLQIKIQSNHVEVLAPQSTSLSEIKSVLVRKKSWIQTQLQHYAERQPLPQHQFKAGERFSILGRTVELKVCSGRAHTGTLNGDTLLIQSPQQTPKSIRTAIEKWYRQFALAHFQERVAHFAPLIEVDPRTISVKTFKRRWGSCSRRRDIVFNWKLIMAPADIIDHVVVHELCHIHHFDHSPQFWQKVFAIMPDYKDKHRWLKTHGYLLELSPIDSRAPGEI